MSLVFVTVKSVAGMSANQTNTLQLTVTCEAGGKTAQQPGNTTSVYPIRVLYYSISL